MNCIVYEDVAHIALISMNVNLAAAAARSTKEVGERTLHGLESLLSRQQGLRIPGLGTILAAGDIATVMTKTAAAPGEANGGLEAALVDFGVPQHVAETFVSGVRHGGLIFMIRVDDERAGEAADLLRDHGARQVSHYG
jgi:hypothetical protein